MTFKLDENISPALAELLKDAGHDVHTVVMEKLGGKGDPTIVEAARAEERCLVTLDLDFANVLSYPPEQHFGIVVLRHPAPKLKEVGKLIGELLQWLQTDDPKGKLWIVEPGRLRVHDD